jgi:hypothetical protein
MDDRDIIRNQVYVLNTVRNRGVSVDAAVQCSVLCHDFVTAPPVLANSVHKCGVRMEQGGECGHIMSVPGMFEPTSEFGRRCVPLRCHQQVTFCPIMSSKIGGYF